MEINTNAPKNRGENPAGEARQWDYLTVGETAYERICRKAEAARTGALVWLIKGASGEQTYADLPPTKLAAFDALRDLAAGLSLLSLQAQLEGPHLVENECEQTLDDIIRLLAVLNGPERDQA